MTVLTFVEAGFSAMHAPFGSAPHGHDWFVRAAWSVGDAPIDYRARLADLDAIANRFDHGDLTELLNGRDTNEGVAEAIGQHLGCVEVEVWRFEKSRRFGAIWRDEK